MTLQRHTPLRRTMFRRKAPKPSPMKQAREAVVRRSSGRCEALTPVCTGRMEHAHHVVRRSQGGKDEPENLLACCAACHGYIHDHPAESFDRGWLRHR
jgi:5-methylcytosine-specific restriction endonuclease McrA